MSGASIHDSRKHKICPPFYGESGPAYTRVFKTDFTANLWLRRIWGAIDSDLVAWGGSGAGLTVARLGRGPSWPCTEHEGAKCRHPPANSVEKNSWLAWIHGSRFLAFHVEKRSVMANTPLSDRPTHVEHTRLTRQPAPFLTPTSISHPPSASDLPHA